MRSHSRDIFLVTGVTRGEAGVDEAKLLKLLQSCKKIDFPALVQPAYWFCCGSIGKLSGFGKIDRFSYSNERKSKSIFPLPFRKNL